VKRSFRRALREPIHLAYFSATSVVAALFYVTYDLGYVSLPYAYLGTVVFGWLGLLLGVTLKFKFKFQRELDTAEARFRALIESSAQIVWIIDADGRPIEDSPSWRAFTGQTFEEWQSKDGWLKVVHPEDRTHAFDVCENSLKTGTPYQVVYRIRHARSGGWRWTEARGTPVRDFHGRVKCWVGMNDDITEQKLAEQKLAESEEHFRTLAETSGDFIWLADANGKVYYWNPAWFKYTGFSPKDSLGSEAKSALREDVREKTYAAWLRALAAETPFQVEVPVCRNDGEYRWFLSRAHPVRGEGGRIIRWTGVMTDIHDQKVAIDRLCEERDLREKFVATLTHDLRNALASGKASIDYLMRHPENPAVRESKYHIIYRSFIRTDRMIQDLLDANQLQAGQAFPLKEPQKFEVREFLRETVDDLSHAFDKRFVVDCAGSLEVCWSRADMKRVIENLACNAKKYGATDRPITIGARREKAGIRMWVHNWGPPIPEREQQKLFHFLERSTKARMGGEQGWGIGLTLVKGIVEAHKGRIEVYSTTGDGTTFHLHMPNDVSVQAVPSPNSHHS